MVMINPCDCVSKDYPIIESIEAPDFKNITEFEAWLRMKYIPRTNAIKHWINPRTKLTENICQTECWGIFTPDEKYVKCCLTYPKTNLTSKCEDDLRGNILSHNHPSGETLSLADLCNWANLHMQEIRAVNEIFTYRITPISGKWPEPKKLIDKIKTICPKVIPDDMQRSSGDLRHKCFMRLSEVGCFDYERL